MAFTFPAIPTPVPPILQVQFPFAGGDDGAGGIIAWQNPEPGPILVYLFDINPTAPATAACTADAGGAATKAGLGTSNLRNSVANDVHTTPLARISVFSGNGAGYPTTSGGSVATDSPAPVLLGVAEWLVMETNTGASAGLAGVTTIQYSPLP